MTQTLSINSSFLSLQPYPNKQLLSRSKIAKFSSNSQLFQQRCALLAEVCYLLLKLQTEERSVYLSKTMYLSPQGLLFMLFSFEEQFKDRLKLIQFFSLDKNLTYVYDTIFNSKEQQSGGFEDCQLEHIYACTRQLFSDLGQTRPKARDFKSEKMQVECACDEYHSTKDKLCSSLLFQEYCFPLKISTAIMIRPIVMARHFKGNQIMATYIELLGTQEGIFRAMNYETGDFDVKGIFSVYGDKMKHFFKLMQADNYLKITNIEEDNKYMKKNSHQVFQMAFCSNLRKMGHVNTTALQNSSEQSGNNVSEEEKQKNTKKIEYLQTLAHLKNEIHFQIDIFYDNQRKQFKVEIEGQSQWVIEEYYYNFFWDLWTEFINKWLSSSFGVDEKGEEGRTHKWKMIQRQKNPIIYERFYLTDRNLLKEIIVVIDKIVIMLLLFENILKNLYKTGLSLKEYEKLSLGNLENAINLDGLVSLYGQTINEYLTFEDILQQIDFDYLKR